MAILSGEGGMTENLLNAQPALARETLPGAGHATPLHLTALHGLPDAAEKLLASGADVGMRDQRFHDTALGWAVHVARRRRPGVARPTGCRAPTAAPRRQARISPPHVFGRAQSQGTERSRRGSGRNGRNRVMRPALSLVIAGGAQSAKNLLFTLAEHMASGDRRWRGSRITVVEKSHEFATGLAWSRRYALEEHLSSLAAPVSRVCYGDGQRQQFEGAVALLREFGVEVTLAPRQEVVRMTPDGAAWSAELASGVRLLATAAVLATGYWETPDPLAGRPWILRVALAGAGVAGRRLTAPRGGPSAAGLDPGNLPHGD